MLVSRTGSASSSGYIPAVPTDWHPPPSTVSSALDQAGARIEYLETHGTPSGPMTAEYDCPVTVVVYDVVGLVGVDYVDKSSAVSVATAPAIGIVAAKIGPTRCVVQLNGRIENPTWTLAPDTTYYLERSSPPDGSMVAEGAYPWPPNPPWIPGSVVQKIGVAEDTTTMLIMVDRDVVIL